jgi:hypothetical protein
MATLTLSDTPEGLAANLPAAGHVFYSVTDARGRKIEGKKLTALDRMRLAIVLGAANSENQQVLIYANLAYSVTAIDGEERFRPASMREVEHIVGVLDEDGLAGIMRGWQDAGWLGDVDPEMAVEQHRDAVKNSSGTLASEAAPGS